MHKVPIQSLFIGSKLLKLPSCHSTNSVASDLLAENKLVHGAVIITDNQTAGRGQRGNTWESETGQNLTLSIVVKPFFLPVARQFELTVITSLAIIKTLQSNGISTGKIKWPNDIFVGNGKIAGILIENIVRSNQLEWAILGIGLNVNQETFRTSSATSIKLELGHALSLDKMLEHLLKSLNEFYDLLKSGKLQVLRDLYTGNLMWINQTREFLDTRINKSFKGVIVRVNDDGRLVVRSEGNESSYDFKQIAFLG